MSDPSAIPKAPLRGRLEEVVRTAIAGWAMDPAAPGETVELELLIDGIPEGRLPARTYRADLEKAGIGDGRHGFRISIPGGLPPAQNHEIRVRHATDGRELLGSPATLPAEPAAAGDAPATLAAAIEHAAAATEPTDPDALISVLAEQAAALLLSHGSAMPEPAAVRLARLSHAVLPARPANARPVALFIADGLPGAEHDGAALSHLRALQRLGFRVHAVAADDIAHAGARTVALGSLGITCWHAPWIGSVEEVLRGLAPGLRLVYAHGFAAMRCYAALVRHWCPGARLVYNVAGLHHLHDARRVAIEAGLGADAPEGAAAAAGLRTAELLAVLGADAVIAHSSHEAALLRREVPDAELHLLAWDVPVRPVATPLAERRGVAFIGCYDAAAELDAAHILIEQVMPIVWGENPDIDCLLAGGDLPASLRAAVLRAPEGRVQVLRRPFPADAVFNRVRVTAAPFRYGAGVKGSVLDSLAAGLPCVCSPLAAEGMDLPAALDPLIGTDNTEMAAAILGLHADDAAYASLARIGLDWVAATLSAARLDTLLRPAVLPA